MSTPSFSTHKTIQKYIQLALARAEHTELPPLPSPLDAQVILDELWKVLDSSALPAAASDVHFLTYRTKLRRLTLRVAIKYEILPAALVLRGVECADGDVQGAGGFADVFCGTYQGLKVALKRLRVYIVASETKQRNMRRAFYRESILWKNLVHDHIVPFLGISEDVFGGKVCMVIPWLERGSLRSFIDVQRDQGNLLGGDFVVAVNNWLRQIALGLEYLHGEGLVHGDLHAGNILVDEDGDARLTDFGMTLISESSAYNYASIHGGGAIRWTAPELIDPESFGCETSRPTFSSDVYSFALTCIELYTGEPPLQGFNDFQVARRIVAGTRPPRPTPQDRGIMSDALWTLITSCWVQQASNRPSCHDVVGALESMHRHDTSKPSVHIVAGPMLCYDTVDSHGVWRGAAMIVTSDADAICGSNPTLTFWERHRLHNSVATTTPHRVIGKQIWVYNDNTGLFIFWRFMIEIPLGSSAMRIEYCIDDGRHLAFHIPARDENMRWAAFSKSDFNTQADPDEFRGGFDSGYEPLWRDLLLEHEEQPYHILVGVGGQICGNKIWREPEISEWANLPDAKTRETLPLTPKMIQAIDRFYFTRYCQIFGEGPLSRANSSIPMLNMLDGTDIVSGFGSGYPDAFMRSPVFAAIGSRGYFYFLLFQCFINPELDSVLSEGHPFKSVVIGDRGTYIPFPSHSFISYAGPQVYITLLDCRAERNAVQVCSKKEYGEVVRRVSQLPPAIEHLVLVSGNSFMATGQVTFSSQVAELKSLVHRDVILSNSDSWTSKPYKTERTWLIDTLQHYAYSTRTRVSVLSGNALTSDIDVNIKTSSTRGTAPQIKNHRYILNVMTSGIVDPPPSDTVTVSIKSRGNLHLSINQSRPKGRNWCNVTWDQSSGDLMFEIVAEGKGEEGQTIRYISRAPPPRW